MKDNFPGSRPSWLSDASMKAEMVMKILVLEESTLARRFIKDELQPTGYEIHEARNPEEALGVLTTVPGIDLITLRVVLKGMDGFEFLEHLQTDEVRQELVKTQNHKVPAMFVTSNDTDKDRLRGFQVGAADFIQKPWPPGDLLKTVNRVLGCSTELAGMSVLVVDDSRTARSFIKNSLTRLGVEIHEADDGDTAVEFLRDPANEVDLVITDLLMERMNGDALTIAIRGELGYPELPVIFLSGNDDKDKILALFKMGATDYLKKPFLQEELISRMRAYLTRVQVQTSLKESVARLRDINLVKDQFLAACSHDLRSPLTGILGYAQLLQGDDSLAESHQEMVGGIKRSGDYLLQLINDLLDIGKMASGRTEIRHDEVELFDVVQDSERSLVHTAGPKGVKLDSFCSSEDTRVTGDRSSLMRICNNLLSNAIKFTPAGGSVTISVRDGRAGELILAVTDSGIGIKNDDIPDLFKRYTRVSQAGTYGEKGTGLGLSITRDLVDAHGGTVAVESTVGEGTTFRIHLPTLSSNKELPVVQEVVEEEPMIQLNMPGEEQEAEAPTEEAPSLLVLLVDDQEINRKVGSALLKKMGFEIETANDGAEALKMYKVSCRKRRYDLILMDMEMPVLNGLDATRKVRAFEQGLPEDHEASNHPVTVLAMTANSGDVSLGECLSAGMNDFLTKPFVVSQITEAIDRWVMAPA
jgi:CheY-like chemotaxis protein/nitrogen-specific signal transduction histidine kinase